MYGILFQSAQNGFWKRVERTELKLLECQKNVILKHFMKKNIVDESFANIAKNDSLDASNSDNNSTKTL